MLEVDIIPLAETVPFRIVRVLLGLTGTKLLDFEFKCLQGAMMTKHVAL